MADAVIIGQVGTLHERNPLLRSEDEHHPIVAAMRVVTPGFQGGSPLGVIYEPKRNVVVAGHGNGWRDRGGRSTMKGVEPNYLLFKERKAVYIFSTGTVAGCGPSKRAVSLCPGSYCPEKGRAA
jgi:hypothetical protein